MEFRIDRTSVFDYQHFYKLRKECRYDLHNSKFYSPEECKNWLERLVDNPHSERYSIWDDESQDFIGAIRIDNIDHVNQTCSVGVDIVPEYRRQGVAQAAYTHTLYELFAVRNFYVVWLEVLQTNTIAKMLYNKMGFKQDGILRGRIFRNNQRIDVVSMSMTRDEWFNNEK